MTTQWERMTPEQRLTAATVDIMSHKDFALLSGIVMMGKVQLCDAIAMHVPDGIRIQSMSTAATDGLDCMYNPQFMGQQDRAQHRWVILHENFHKALHHCTEYKDIVEKYPNESNRAQDFVINAMIDELDPAQGFAKQPADIDICLNKKYYGWSFIEVLRDLLKNPPKGGGKGQGEGAGAGGSGQFDIHIRNPNSSDPKPTQEQEKELKKIKQMINDALYQGKMTVERMAGKGKGNNPLDALTQKRVTDWKTPLREFIEQICTGYDNSRFCPPNKRFMPLGILMPSHFSESTGEIQVYCDTSGSMTGVYPTVFGEIARIAENVKPSSLRIIWWDDGIHSEQLFTEVDYDQIANLMKPGGGGGTTPSCVVQYVAEKQYKPKAGIWLTDGYLDGGDCTLPFPVLWGVVDNESFIPPQGKKINIESRL